MDDGFILCRKSPFISLYFKLGTLNFAENGIDSSTESIGNLLEKFPALEFLNIEPVLSVDSNGITENEDKEDYIPSNELNSEKLVLALRYLCHKRTRITAQQRHLPFIDNNKEKEIDEPLIVEFLNFIQNNSKLFLNK